MVCWVCWVGTQETFVFADIPAGLLVGWLDRLAVVREFGCSIVGSYFGTHLVFDFGSTRFLVVVDKFVVVFDSLADHSASGLLNVDCRSLLTAGLVGLMVLYLEVLVGDLPSENLHLSFPSYLDGH